MSQRKMKRPSSARHKIKYETFSQFVSSTRLRHIQDLLDEKQSSLAKPDAILCITGICQLRKSLSSIGIDSRYNDGNYELVNYLLFGFFDVRKAELERSGFDEEVIDDLMILIRKCSVDVYCNPINYHYLLPYVSHWHNITFHCLTEDQYKDEEVGENFKIQSLITMVSGCKKIGIPYSSTARPQTFDKLLIEKWPVVQAYALEHFGSGGFLTMKKEVVDVSSCVREFYSLMDPVSLEMMVTHNLPLLEKQWNNMMLTINMELSSHPGYLSEAIVLESLKTYFNHGRTGTECAKSSKQPFVLFGVHATESNLNKVCTAGGIGSGDGLAGQSHTMICQAVAPKCPLTCTRTYFFTPAYNPFQEPKNLQWLKDVDLEHLITIYRGMVAGVVAGIDLYAKTLSVSQAKLKAVETLQDDCKALKTTVLWKYLTERSNINFAIEAMDNHGKCKALDDGLRSLQVKVATMKLCNIPSVHTSGKTKGLLMFAESFLDSVISVQDQDTSPTLSSEVLLLTSHIPRIHLWNNKKEDVAVKKEIQALLQQPDIEEFGHQLMTGEKVDVTTGIPVSMPPSEYRLYMYEHGLIVLRPESGAIALHGSHIKSISLYDGESPSQALLLVIELHQSSANSLPPHLQSAHNTLVVIIHPRSKARRHLLSAVLPQLKRVEDCQVPVVDHIDTLPDHLQSVNDVLRVKYEGSIDVGLDEAFGHITTLQKATVMLPSLTTFLDHFKVSSIGFTSLSSDDLKCCLKQASYIPASTSKKLVVTILSGIPGSHKDQLCRTLTNLAQENIRWIVLSAPKYETSPFNAEHLQTSLKSAYSTHQKLASTEKQIRVMIVTSGFTDTVDVVRAIVNHPNKEVAENIVIGSVSVCIDPQNTFMEHRWPFPVLLNQCAQGWVNCIISMSSTEIKNDLLEEVQSLIRCINSDVALLVANKTVISRSTDLDLILSDSNFMQPKMVRSRLLLYPGWKKPSFQNMTSHSMSSICLKFSKSLEKVKFVNRLRDLKRTLSSYPFKGNIYFIQGSLHFADSQQLMDVQYVTLTGALTIHPSNGENRLPQNWNYSCYVVCTGSGLEESQLKDWLRGCTKQRPQKKKIISRKDISQEDINRIHKQHHLDVLPAGWFYSGTHFVSMGGEKSNLHPNLEEFINQWLKDKNEEISKYNEKIDAQPFVDLFA
ncbi:uncharacterized protein C20orf194-like [Gigantopelta aegis]|uniref:uncharacterized protein C20orf194-like n=1 Tax=Gigantopelta aegis TaxID=1735272 RepID=UPI001B889075|nr:uncharacterized protein C20orf194-like [Gigantopelta aegis]